MAARLNDRPKKYHAPLREKLESELLYAIKNRHDDMIACRLELRRRGWSDADIAERLAA